MKRLPVILSGIFCVSCSSVHERSKAEAFVVLSPLEVATVDFSDGVQKDEAVEVASAYAQAYIMSCGNLDDPVEIQTLWCVQLRAFPSGENCGRLWLSRNGNRVLYESFGSGIDLSSDLSQMLSAVAE